MAWVSTETTGQAKVYHTLQCETQQAIRPEHLAVMSEEGALRSGYSEFPRCRDLAQNGMSMGCILAFFGVVAVVVLYLVLSGQIDIDIDIDIQRGWDVD